MEQFKRASSSIPMNLSEGYSRLSKKDKQSYLRIAKGSAFECVAIIDILKRIDAIRFE
jgi:four helix bundle protein